MAARCVDADATGNMGMLQLDDEPHARPVETREAKGVDFQHGANTSVDVADLLRLPMLLRQVLGRDMREPSWLADETVISILHAFQAHHLSIEPDWLGLHCYFTCLSRTKV